MAKPTNTLECARVLKAIADHNRLAILRALMEQERTVTELANALGMTQPHVSHHLAILRHAGLVDHERDRNRVLNRLHPLVQDQMARQPNVIELDCCRLELRPAPVEKPRLHVRAAT